MTELLDNVFLSLEGDSLPCTSCRGKKLQLVNLQASFTKDAEELLSYSAGFGCCSFVPSVPFLLSHQCPILLHLILTPFVLLGWGGEASLHLKERGFGRSGVPLLCVGLKLGLALLIDAE